VYEALSYRCSGAGVTYILKRLVCGGMKRGVTRAPLALTPAPEYT
jgi:hypothetical protein